MEPGRRFALAVPPVMRLIPLVWLVAVLQAGSRLVWHYTTPRDGRWLATFWLRTRAAEVEVDTLESATEEGDTVGIRFHTHNHSGSWTVVVWVEDIVKLVAAAAVEARCCLRAEVPDQKQSLQVVGHIQAQGSACFAVEIARDKGHVVGVDSTESIVYVEGVYALGWEDRQEGHSRMVAICRKEEAGLAHECSQGSSSVLL